MSIFKTFRNYRREEANFNTFSNRFDQPTYLSFKLVFAENGDDWYSGSGGAWDAGLNFDRMPHPLFVRKSGKPIEERQRYSSVDYLYDSNEITRARMLEEFQLKWKNLQDNNQWYFQKIDGIDGLLEIDNKRGIRVTQDKRLTITTLEGIDLRMTHLLNLYRKIAWDDTYQRWILPDMMRYFSLKIYISEYRTFHAPNRTNDFGGPSTIRPFKEGELLLSVMDQAIPTWVIKCEMCEFDLESIKYGNIGSLNLNETPEEQTTEFKIKVGKIYEEQVYPMFKNMYLIDKAINGFDRSKETDIETNLTGVNFQGNNNSTTTESREIPFDSTKNDTGNRVKYGNNLDIAQNLPWRKNTVDDEGVHISGTPFNRGLNDEKPIPTQIVDNRGGISSVDPGDKPGWISWDSRNYQIQLNLTQDEMKAGWASNLAKWGEAFAENAVNKSLDLAKVTPIPGLGLSFSEVEAALRGQDLVTAFGLLKKSIDVLVNETPPPSALLEKKPYTEISHDLFLGVLEQLSNSDATDDNPNKIDNLLRESATTVLNNRSLLAKISDYSMATDITGPGERNITNPIEGGMEYKGAVDEQISGDLSHATNLVGPGESNVDKKLEGGPHIYEGIPTSRATNGNLE